MAKQKRPPTTSTSRPKEEVIQLGRTAKSIVQFCAAVLVVMYGWLKLKGVDIGLTIGTVPSDVYVRAGLIIYFFSWVYGLINDTQEQEIVYAAVPARGAFPWPAAGLGCVITAVFALLCYVHNGTMFALVLLSFLALNVIAWRWMAGSFAPKAYAASKRKYIDHKDYIALVSLDIVYAYLTGRWQWARFICGILLGIVILILAVTPIPTMLSAQIPSIPAESFLALAILGYVVVMEGWVWIHRVKVKMSIKTIKECSQKYSISPIREA